MLCCVRAFTDTEKITTKLLLSWYVKEMQRQSFHHNTVLLIVHLIKMTNDLLFIA